MPNHLKQADDSGLGQAHESECSEDVKATDEEVPAAEELNQLSLKIFVRMHFFY